MKAMAGFLLLTFFLAAFTGTDAGSLELPVYTQSYTTVEFLYQQNLPEMIQNTLCFWINLGADDDGYDTDNLFSISTAMESHSFTLGFTNEVFIYLGNTQYTIAPSLSDVIDLFIGWHKHCFTWMSGRFFKWYAEVNTPGVMELHSTISIPSYTVQSGGALILMQEQDGYFSTQDLSRVTTGKIAWVNIWNYAMSENQIKMLRCRDEGNVVNWNTLSQQGADCIHYEWFQCQEQSPASTCQLQVYVQTETTSNYLYQTSLPAMSEYSVCFWITTESDNDDDNRESDAIFSISTTGYDNELYLAWYNPQSLAVSQRGTTRYLNDDNKEQNDRLFVGWHKHCFTFKDSTFKWYADESVPGELQLINSISFPADNIRSDGYLIMAQEQDSFGGGLDVNQMVSGQYTWFNFWDYEMSLDQLNGLSCAERGNAASWDDLLGTGSSIMFADDFPDRTQQENSSASTCQLQVYVQTETTSNYLYQTSLPAMSEYTCSVCFWITTESDNDDDNRESDAIFSISTSSSDNELYLAWYNPQSLAVSQRGTTEYLNDDDKEQNDRLFVGWHKHCFTFKDSTFKWYADESVPGKLQLINSISLSANNIRSDGYLIIALEQDNFGGGLDVNQMVPGQYTWFNFWDYEMSLDQLNGLSCAEGGNAASWDDLLETGSSTMFAGDFPDRAQQGNSSASTCQLQVYVQTKTTSKYLYQTGLPAMSEYSVCFWITTESDNDDDNRQSDAIFSISTSSSDNELYIGWYNPQSLAVSQRGTTRYLNDDNEEENDRLFVGWHKHCFTFKDSIFKWYADESVPGELQLINSISLSANNIRSDGYLIIAQEQDSFGGGLDVDQMVPGQYTWFNFWDYEMSLDQLNGLSCAERGNAAAWDDFLKQESSATFAEDFLDRLQQDGELNNIEKNFENYLKQEMTLCKISGASLVGAMNTNSETVGIPSRCVLLCTKSDSCLSANYQYSTGVCTLNDDIDQGNEDDFSVNLGSDYVHFTARECVDA